MNSDEKLLAVRRKINHAVSDLHKSFFGSDEDLKKAIENLYKASLKIGSEFELYLKRCGK